MQLALHYRYNDFAEKVMSFTIPEIVLGRPKNVPVHLDLSPDNKVSRPHARLFYDCGTWWIEDLGSKHGTAVNGQFITQITELAPEDAIQIGETLLRLEFDLTKTDRMLLEGTLKTYKMQDLLPPASLTEDHRLEFLTQARQIVTATSSDPEQRTLMYGTLLRLIRNIFPNAAAGTIALREDKELVPLVFFPEQDCKLSYSLSRRVITGQEALRWLQAANPEEKVPTSLSGVLSALYVPILHRYRVLGILHVDTREERIFEEVDLQALSDLALTLGRVISNQTDYVPDDFPSVFVSYAHKDRPLIDQLTGDLRRRQVSVWFDERLRGGEKWRQQIYSAIEACDATVLVITPQSMASAYVQLEVETALRLGKKLLPLLAEPIDLPPYLSEIQYIDLHQDYQSSLSELVETLYQRR